MRLLPVIREKKVMTFSSGNLICVRWLCVIETQSVVPLAHYASTILFAQECSPHAAAVSRSVYIHTLLFFSLLAHSSHREDTLSTFHAVANLQALNLLAVRRIQSQKCPLIFKQGNVTQPVTHSFPNRVA